MTDFRPTTKDRQLVENFSAKYLKGEVSEVETVGSRIVLTKSKRQGVAPRTAARSIAFQRTGTDSYRLQVVQNAAGCHIRTFRDVAQVGKTAPLRQLLADLAAMYLPGEVAVESNYDPRALDGLCERASEEIDLHELESPNVTLSLPDEPGGLHNLDLLVPALERRVVAEKLVGAPLVFQRRIGTAELCIPEGALVTPGLLLLMNEGCPPEFEVQCAVLGCRDIPKRAQEPYTLPQGPPGDGGFGAATQLLDEDHVRRDDHWDLPGRLPDAKLSWLELYDLRVSLNAILTNTSLFDAFPIYDKPRRFGGPLPGVTVSVEKPKGTTDLGWFGAIAASVRLLTPSAKAQVAGLGTSDYELNAPPNTYDFSSTGAIPRGALGYLSNKTDSQRYWDD